MINDSAEGNAIRRIARDSVHRICSGQVVLSLAVAIKELVENSLDANASNVEVRLKEYGSESIEVIDNGFGVEEKDFQNLTIKHCTSKLKEFEDLVSVETFGFRGEALSSLCALSKLSIITCHETSSTGTLLEYDHSGNITKRVVCPRQVGTTVRIQDLFSTLPVRHKEFTKNLKREFAKAINMLYGYCLVAGDKRIVCTNQIGKIKNPVISMNGSGSSKDNILDTFGAKQFSSLLEIRQCPPSADVMEEYFLKESEVGDDFFQIVGFVSVSTHGKGRCTKDRQFCSINGRPCDLPKVTKVVNEVYHTYNKLQYPFLLLDISLKKDSVDLNVTPDKREIFVENEKLLLAIIKTSLIALYESQSSRLCVSSTQITRKSDESPSATSNTSLQNTVNESAGFYNFKRKFSFLPENKNIPESPSIKQPRLDSFFTKLPEAGDSAAGEEDSTVPEFKERTTDVPISSPTFRMTFSNDIMTLAKSRQASSGDQLSPKSQKTLSTTNEDAVVPIQQSSKHVEKASRASSDKVESQFMEEVQPKFKRPKNCLMPRRKVKVLSFSMVCLRRKLCGAEVLADVNGIAEWPEGKFLAKIDRSANSDAEQELKREIHKDSFEKMDIIGQFNVGFIIAKLNSDLFIIDQHATDEKYNYEDLQKNTVLETQKLISPQSLDLTVSNETLLSENMDVFRMNGFGFDVNMSADAGNRIRLSSIPVSKNWTFGKQDIDEMLFMLSDALQGVMCRPSRVQQMLASRACRKSIMIGTHLAQHDMKKLVNHMSEMDQPWNCPHGRPTMRHLVSLSRIAYTYEQ